MNRKILKLALPNIITNITVPLLGMVDLGLMGHLESANYVGAIAIGGMIFNFLFWGFGFLRMGTSGFTAQAYGARNLHESTHLLIRSLTIALLGGLLLIVLQKPILSFSFLFLEGDASVKILTEGYFNIRIYSAPATLCMFAIMGWLIGMQNARTPMLLAIFINLANIGYSLLFIKLFQMKSEGIAWANVLSQCSGFVLAGFLMRGYLKHLRPYLSISNSLQWRSLLKFMSVNGDIFIRTLCLIFVLSFFTTQSANAGVTLLAVNTLLFQFFYFFSYFMDGFAYAAEALTGRYLGANDPLSLKRLIRKLFAWGVGLALLFTLIYLSAGTVILTWLTNNQEVLQNTKPYLLWIATIPLLTFAAFLWDGIYIGATASVAMRNSMVIITLLIFLPVYYLLRTPLGNHGLWLATMLFMASRGIFLTVLSKQALYGKSR